MGGGLLAVGALVWFWSRDLPTPREESPAAPPPQGIVDPVKVHAELPVPPPAAMDRPEPRSPGSAPVPDRLLPGVEARRRFVDVQALDSRGQPLQQELGYEWVPGRAILAGASLLNGATQLRLPDGGRLDLVQLLDARGLVLAFRMPVPDMASAPLRHAELAVDEPLFAPHVTSESWWPVGLSGERSQWLGLLAPGATFLVDAAGQLAAVGLRAEPREAVLLGTRELAEAVQSTRPSSLEQIGQLLFGNDALAHRELAVIYASLEDWRAAARQYLRAIELDPSLQSACGEALTTALRMATQGAVAAGTFAEVTPLLEQAVQQLPGQAALLQALGVVLIRQQRYPRAIEILARAVYLDPTDADAAQALRDAYVLQGESLRAEGFSADAADLLQEGLTAFPDDLLMLKALGYARYQSLEYALAYQSLARVAELDAGQERQLEAILQRLQELLQDRLLVEIPFDPRSGGIHTSAVFGGSRRASVLVDTGATLTAVSTELARALGFDPESSGRRVDVVTASGRLRAPVITLPSIDLQGAMQYSVDAVVLPLEQVGDTEALIGLNFLQHFEVQIDSRLGRLQLRSQRR